MALQTLMKLCSKESLFFAIGATGRNFAAGMSGGIAYVYNPDKILES